MKNLLDSYDTVNSVDNQSEYGEYAAGSYDNESSDSKIPKIITSIGGQNIQVYKAPNRNPKIQLPTNFKPHKKKNKKPAIVSNYEDKGKVKVKESDENTVNHQNNQNQQQGSQHKKSTILFILGSFFVVVGTYFFLKNNNN